MTSDSILNKYIVCKKYFLIDIFYEKNNPFIKKSYVFCLTSCYYSPKKYCINDLSDKRMITIRDKENSMIILSSISKSFT